MTVSLKSVGSSTPPQSPKKSQMPSIVTHNKHPEDT